MTIILTTLIGGLLGLAAATLLAYKPALERRSGLLWGTYRWSAPTERSGPPPLFGLVLRPGGTDWMRFELIIAGRAVYLTRWRD